MTSRTRGTQKRIPGSTRTPRNVISSYKVGYSWNRGGRLKELRIRHLARKFFKLWMQKSFGRVHPYKARCHHRKVLLQRTLGSWKDEWWSVRREWGLTVRGECHYRYYLYNQVFHGWRRFVSLQKEEKRRLEKATYFAKRQCLRWAWDNWELYIEMRMIKSRMQQSALQFQKFTAVCRVWAVWQAGLQKRYETRVMEDRALGHSAGILLSRAWRQWRAEYVLICCWRARESKASLHYIHALQKKALCCWISYVQVRLAKKKPQDAAGQAWRIHSVRNYWDMWRSRLQSRKREVEREQASVRLAQRITKRWALERWRRYVELSILESEKYQDASQHHQRNLLLTVLRNLNLNVTRSKTHRLNKHIAVQHHHYNVTGRFWILWQQRLEEAEDQGLEEQMRRARSYHSNSLQRNCLRDWRAQLVENRHMKGLEQRAEAWFAEHILPQCLDSWMEFTYQSRLLREKTETVQLHQQQRLYSWAFCTWWGRSDERKEQRLAERMAILHEQRSCLLRAWDHWRRRATQVREDREKQTASDTLYQRTVIHNTLSQWKDNVTVIIDRRNREEQAGRRGDLRCVKRALNGWCEYVQHIREKNRRMEQMDSYHGNRLLKHTLQHWKKYHLQTQQIFEHVDELYTLQQQCFLRRILRVWKENAAQLAAARIRQRRAEKYYQQCVQAKVLLAWRKATSYALANRHRQEEALSMARVHLDKILQRGTFSRWRERSKQVVEEKTGMEKAERHHQCSLLSTAFRSWERFQKHQRSYKLMKERGHLLLRRKTCQLFFTHWKVELQNRHRDNEKTELALWHWSLSLQAKVLWAWRQWFARQHRKQERLAQAAQFYREQLLREGVAHILTYTAHTSTVNTSVALYSQEQSAKRIQRVVLRCAMRWKQQALCGPKRARSLSAAAPFPRKSVTFCLPEPMSSSTRAQSGTVHQGDGECILNHLVTARASRLQPRRPRDLLDSPVKELLPPAVPSHQIRPSPLLPKTPVPEAATAAASPFPITHVLAQPATNLSLPTHRSPEQELLLPPSAFISTHTSTEPSIHHQPPESDGDVFAEEEEVVVDPTLAWTRELINIRLEMQRFQRDRKQLQAWRRLEEVMRRWLETTGLEEGPEERTSVKKELEELEERISRLSTDLAAQKPGMILHATRIDRIECFLHSSTAK
ncbi:hypothetical protein UPYG_G00166870 [Umbra pygmaea]|uniref:Sfi1 spindle body domain-containing protein n=1 Tax=Umbra pygmaea TaxID=75934 RepID=A0ABD0WSS0_UMBPY